MTFSDSIVSEEDRLTEALSSLSLSFTLTPSFSAIETQNIPPFTTSFPAVILNGEFYFVILLLLGYQRF